jgi:hypothetical protein
MKGYRKITVAVLGIIGALVLCYLGKIADGVCSTMVITITGGFFTASVAKATLVRTPATPVPAPTVTASVTPSA